jgi:hypothetical protein
MNQLERWFQDGDIHVDMSEVAHHEARQGGDPKRTAKALAFIFSMTRANTADEQRQMRAIEAILYPDGASQNARNDVEIAFNSLKHGRIQIANDDGSRSHPAGILGMCDELACLGTKIMHDSEAVEYVRSDIYQRHVLARQISSLTRDAVPAWVGQDKRRCARCLT